ncbi:MAG: substrate-binding domain-containing protein [Armatimonadetes bacterium]|nr:substrate-binding domain-containing protein [Armatimonadota bacterium]
MKRKLLLGLLGSAIFAGAIAGCGNKSATTTTGTAKKAVSIALICKSSTNPVFMAAKTGAEAAAKLLGEKNGIEIKINWLTPPTEDGQVQAQKIAQSVNNGDDAIIISCSDAGKVKGAIDDAVSQGVEVMAFDSDATGSKRFAFYGVDDIKCGEQVMDELATQLGKKGKVAILAGNQNAPNLRKRAEGVKQAAKKYPGITIVDTYYHTETPQDAAAKVLEVMNAHPEITGWAMIGGWPLFTKTLLTDLDPAKVKVVAVDCLPAQLPYIEKGIAPVLLAQPCYMWGYVSVEKVIDKIVLKKEVPVMNEMKLIRVTKENLGDYARQLKEQGFDVPEKYLKMK